MTHVTSFLDRCLGTTDGLVEDDTLDAMLPPSGPGAPDGAAPEPAEAAPRRTQTERRAASQRDLLDAAARVIAERGTSKASFAEIAAAAGRSHGHPHYIFGSKANMLDALVRAFSERFSTEVVAEVVGTTRGLDALTRCVGAFIRSLDDPWPMTKALYVLLGESLGAAPELRPAINEYHRRLRQMLAELIEQGIADGDVRADADPALHAATIVALVRGIGLQALSDPGTLDLAELERQAIHQIEQALRAEP